MTQRGRRRHPEDMVACKLCHAQFAPSGAPTQGHGCASSVYEFGGIWFVAGHYGSRLFDTHRYKFIEPKHPDDASWLPKPTEPTDPVCDVCISIWVRLEMLERVEGCFL